MLGRGLVADPSLVRQLQGGPPVDRETLHHYLTDLYESYCADFGNRRNALGRMKEVWFYQCCLFEGTEKHIKKLRKTTDPAEYQATVERIFAECPLRPEGAVPTW
jgi:tRNA-dihydrouridine synthase